MAMNRYVRRCTLGAFAGLVGSIVLAVALGNGLVGVVLGTVIGLGYGWAVEPRSGGYIDTGLAAAALGVPLWAAVSVVLLPLAAGEEPLWTTEGMRLAFPAFVGWVLYSVSLGLAARRWATSPQGSWDRSLRGRRRSPPQGRASSSSAAVSRGLRRLFIWSGRSAPIRPFP